MRKNVVLLAAFFIALSLLARVALAQESDSDGDGIPDSVDNCPDVYNPDQNDIDLDEIGDACDWPDQLDIDGDGITDDVDNCPEVSNPGQEDTDSNGVGDACEYDSDSDGVMDSSDNCVFVYNPDQSDMDNDRIGDICDRCGTPACPNPNEVSNCQELQDIRNAPAAEYKLVNDINCSGHGGVSGFTPIGDHWANSFTGTFDGRNYEISNLHINRPSIPYVGLFGYANNADIKDVGLIDVDVNGKEMVGGLIGWNSYGSVSNCYSTGRIINNGDSAGGLIGYNFKGKVINSYSTGNVSGENRIGGLLGGNELGSVSNSYSTGCVYGVSNGIGGLIGTNNGKVNDSYSTASVSSSQYGRDVGGLVGSNHDAGGVVDNSYATGSVSGRDNVGGLVGSNRYSTISNSYSTGSVTSTRHYAGGLIGYTSDGQISNSYSTGSVNGNDYVGGLVGWNRGGTVDGTVDTSYSTGSVNGNSYVGGLIGRNTGSVSNSYWDINTSGQTSSDGGTGKTTAEMLSQSTFVNWDFVNVWDIDEGVSYPYLQWQVQDSDGDGVDDDQDNCINDFNPDQLDSDADGAGDVCDICPSDATNTCDPEGSAAAYIPAEEGGALATGDGSATVTIPAGALAEGASISITDTDSGTTGFELTTNQGAALGVFSIDLQPPQDFNAPVTIVLAWDDANNDGWVDGTNAKEDNLIITKDNEVITGKCKDEPTGDPALPDCDQAVNTFAFQVSSWSEFALAYPKDTDLDDVPDDFAGVTDNCPATPNADQADSDGDGEGDACDPVADPGGPYLVQIGGAVVLDGSGSSDPDGHILTYAWAPPDDLDDSEVVDPTYTADEVGVHTLTLTVTDPENMTDSEATYVVVYDPDGGFVTGGGWIMSPEGACPNFCGGATGKANFGFVSKYKKGASVPTGQTEFQFKAGDLNFHSSSYEWLVIAGANAKYKGLGTINGEGNYGFMLTATDAELTSSTDVDLFRIKIWDKDNGDEVVYDNKMGEPDDGHAGTAIGGGNIKLHNGK